MYTKRNHTLAAVPEQFRAEITLTDPDGRTDVWHEGPYPKRHIAQARITFWRNHYAQEPGREGWSVDGEVQYSPMTWRKL